MTNATHTFGHAALANEPLVVDALTHLLRAAPKGWMSRALYAHRQSAPSNTARHLMRAIARLKALSEAIEARGKARFSLNFAKSLRAGRLLIAADLIAALMMRPSRKTAPLRRQAHALISMIVERSTWPTDLPAYVDVHGWVEDVAAIQKLLRSHREADFDALAGWLKRRDELLPAPEADKGFLADVATARQVLFDSYAGRDYPTPKVTRKAFKPIAYAICLGTELAISRLNPERRPVLG